MQKSIKTTVRKSGKKVNKVNATRENTTNNARHIKDMPIWYFQQAAGDFFR